MSYQVCRVRRAEPRALERRDQGRKEIVS
jgi:hypothetical protein